MGCAALPRRCRMSRILIRDEAEQSYLRAIELGPPTPEAQNSKFSKHTEG